MVSGLVAFAGAALIALFAWVFLAFDADVPDEVDEDDFESVSAAYESAMSEIRQLVFSYWSYRNFAGMGEYVAGVSGHDAEIELAQDTCDVARAERGCNGAGRHCARKLGELIPRAKRLHDLMGTFDEV